MTVKDLIEELKQLPEDYIIVTDDYNPDIDIDGACVELAEIEVDEEFERVELLFKYK